MLKGRPSTRIWCDALLFVAFFGFLPLMTSSTNAGTSNGSRSKAATRSYHLPSQPLSEALETFAHQSNREILYEGYLTDGRRSAEVDGVYLAETALEILLAGTGLEADVKDGGFFVVRSSPASSAAAGDVDASVVKARYYGAIQNALRGAFCGRSLDQRIAARLWIARSGEVLQVKMLGLAGERRLAEQLRGARIGPPPANFAQPVTILMQSGAPGDDDACLGLRSKSIEAAR